MNGAAVTLAAALAAALASGASAYWAHSASVRTAEVQKENADRLSDIEMVKLALNILGGEISDKTTESRRFAVALLSQYSGVEITTERAIAWVDGGSISFLNEALGLGSVSFEDALKRAVDGLRDLREEPPKGKLILQNERPRTD